MSIFQGVKKQAQIAKPAEKPVEKSAEKTTAEKTTKKRK